MPAHLEIAADPLSEWLHDADVPSPDSEIKHGFGACCDEQVIQLAHKASAHLHA
jgi:hypothetical protein